MRWLLLPPREGPGHSERARGEEHVPERLGADLGQHRLGRRRPVDGAQEPAVRGLREAHRMGQRGPVRYCSRECLELASWRRRHPHSHERLTTTGASLVRARREVQAEAMGAL